MRALAAVALLALLLGGCTGPSGDCPPAPVFATPVVDGKYMQTDPAQPWQTLVLAPADDGRQATRLSWTASGGGAAFGTPIVAGSALHVVTVVPSDGHGNATMEYDVRPTEAGCRSTPGSLAWDLAAPKAGRMAASGQGVHVMTAGFFENGTLFYTNIPEIDTDPNWPKPDWYAWEGDRPLPVYVYDRDRSEQPPQWKGSHALWTEAHKQTGPTPIDQEVDEATMDTDEGHGLGYFTTIPGFNAALKGLSTTTTHVVRMDPEDGYTRPGYEEHPLYGHALVFYIKVLDVVDAPCPADTPMVLCQTGVGA